MDTSTRAGCAWWISPHKKPLCWTWRLPKVPDQQDYGSRTWALMSLLEDFIAVQAAAGTPVNAIALESPLLPMMGMGNLETTAQTLRLQISLASTVELTAKKHGIRCIEVATASAKLALVGYGRKPKDAPLDFNWKTEMKNAATRQGYAVGDDNQADAIGVGKVAFDHLWGLTV